MVSNFNSFGSSFNENSLRRIYRAKALALPAATLGGVQQWLVCYFEPVLDGEGLTSDLLYNRYLNAGGEELDQDGFLGAILGMEVRMIGFDSGTERALLALREREMGPV